MFSKNQLKNMLEDEPIVAAIKDDEGLKKSLNSDCKFIFILYGNICNISKIVKQVKEADKAAIVHIDLVEGLAAKDISVHFIRENTDADGIISTKPQLIRTARELGFYTIQRFFILDSLSVSNVIKQLSTINSDVIEILPAINSKIVKYISCKCNVPLIVGGIVIDKEDVYRLLNAGAIAVSTSKEDLWTA